MNDPALTLDNDFVRSLPGDPSTDRRSRQVLRACYSRVDPTAVGSPRLLAWSDDVARILDLPAAHEVPEGLVQALAGNTRLPGSEPYAACYGGHQFGTWAGQLGDGRAITLGERRNGAGERWELQLKGAGPTPYSRRADGRAVLRSSVREFLCSEAMHHLGVPTTRALSLVVTGEHVERDMFYDGRPRMEPGAIVTRVAPSFLRFGNYQILAWREDVALLEQLVDYTIDRWFAHLGPKSPERVVRWFEEVCRSTAVMVAHWMRVGFVHGVMNTDNMSVLGLTIDYGPYGWLDDYDPEWTPNTTDLPGRRYCYGNQPGIAQWNLLQFAEALAPLVEDPGALTASLAAYRETYNREYRAMFGAKLGLRDVRGDDDDGLFEGLLERFAVVQTDMTRFFRALSKIEVSSSRLDTASDTDLLAPLEGSFYAPDQVSADARGELARWVRQYIVRSRAQSLEAAERVALMHRANPVYVLRNYVAQQAIDKAEQGDPSEVLRLLRVLQNPYDEQPGCEDLAGLRPEWARNRPGCSALSCSS